MPLQSDYTDPAHTNQSLDADSVCKVIRSLFPQAPAPNNVPPLHPTAGEEEELQEKEMKKMLYCDYLTARM